MARSSKSFAELLDLAHRQGINESIIANAEQLEELKEGLGSTVLKEALPTLRNVKIDHVQRFASDNEELLTELLSNYRSIEELLSSYNAQHDVNLTIDFSSPHVVKKGRAARGTTTKKVSTPSITLDSVKSMQQALKKKGKKLPQVAVGKDGEQITGTLQDDLSVKTSDTTYDSLKSFMQAVHSKGNPYRMVRVNDNNNWITIEKATNTYAS